MCPGQAEFGVSGKAPSAKVAVVRPRGSSAQNRQTAEQTQEPAQKSEDAPQGAQMAAAFMLEI